MATAMFIAGPVARNKATAIGKVTSATRWLTPTMRADASIGGRQASEDSVETAIACGATIARAKAGSGRRPAIIATG